MGETGTLEMRFATSSRVSRVLSGVLIAAFGIVWMFRLGRVAGLFMVLAGMVTVVVQMVATSKPYLRLTSSGLTVSSGPVWRPPRTIAWTSIEGASRPASGIIVLTVRDSKPERLWLALLDRDDQHALVERLQNRFGNLGLAD
jgi:hypothetical protein